MRTIKLSTFVESYLLIWILVGLIPFSRIEGATTATANVTFSVASIDSISVSGNPSALSITTATAGSPPSSISDSSTSYNVTTNLATQRITGTLDTAMPTGLTLAVTLAAPTGGTSAGPVNLTTTAQNLVTGITTLSQSGLAITYTLSATVTAGPVASSTRTVTYTLGP